MLVFTDAKHVEGCVTQPLDLSLTCAEPPFFWWFSFSFPLDTNQKGLPPNKEKRRMSLAGEVSCRHPRRESGPRGKEGAPGCNLGVTGTQKYMWLKVKQEGQTAGFGPCSHLPGFHFGTGCLSRSQMGMGKIAPPGYEPQVCRPWFQLPRQSISGTYV